MLLVNVFISCHTTSNNPQLSNITVLHTIKLLKQLNTSYVLGCTSLSEKKTKKKIVELELGERERGKLKFPHSMSYRGSGVYHPMKIKS